MHTDQRLYKSTANFPNKNVFPSFWLGSEFYATLNTVLMTQQRFKGHFVVIKGSMGIFNLHISKSERRIVGLSGWSDDN